MPDVRSPVDRILTQQEQQQLTPDDVLQGLWQGNRRFVVGDVTHRDHRAQVRASARGQWPRAVVLSCLDSRIPVEDVFDCGIGDLFVARVAGNVVNVDILGSMEFACAVSGAKLVFVLGHEYCGAIKGAIDLTASAALGLTNLTSLLGIIAPAVDDVTGEHGPRTAGNEAFVHRVAEENVRRTLQRIRAESPVLRGLEARGQIAIVGGMYDMETGAVSPIV